MKPPGHRSALWQLGIILMAIQAVLAVGFGSSALSRLRESEVDRAAAELARLAPLVAVSIAPRIATGTTADLQAALDAATAATGFQWAALDIDGNVLADTDRSEAETGSLAFRPEIEAALRGGRGQARRFDASARRETVYAAHAVELGGRRVGIVRAARPLPAIDSAAQRTIRIIGLAAVTSLVLTMIVVAVAARRAEARIARLAAGARQFAAGDFEHHVQNRDTGDLASLAEALDHMRDALGEKIARLQAQQAEQNAILGSMTSGLLALDGEQQVLSVNRAAEAMLGFRNHDARGRLLQELVREPELNRFVDAALRADEPARDELALRSGELRVVAISEPLLDADGHRVGVLVLIDDVTRLRRLEAIRSDFAANVSHELRTPITNISGYVETMMEVGCADEARTREFLTIILRNARRLDAIVEDLLSLSRLEQATAAGAPRPIERRPVPAGRLVDAAVGQVAAAARNKRISIERIGDETIEIDASPQLLEQAIANLLSNAIRYSDEGTRVVVSTERRDDGSTAIAVTDEGPGIAARHLPRLFERFYRVDQARSRDLGGTGLGLAIVKHIVLAHGGAPEVESTVGRGSTFRIVLPARGTPA